MSLPVRLLAALFLLPVVGLAQDGVGTQLVVNPGFELDANQDGWPDGYDGRTADAHWRDEGGNHFLRLGSTTDDVQHNAAPGQSLKLDPNWFRLKLSIRARAQKVQQGKESWHNARVAMSFHDAAGTQVGGWPNVLYWTGWTEGWVTAEREYIIPEGAATLRITPALFQAAGAIDYDDFSVTVLSTRPQLEDRVLPAGIQANWSNDTAAKVTCATRERICLNGLWKFIPRMPDAPNDDRPADGQGWGWLKVPAAWPGKSNESTRPIGPEIWELTVDWSKVVAGWYERRISVPAAWAGRRITLSFDFPQTAATVFVDGQPAGEARWPAGTIDLTDRVQPGREAVVTVKVTCEPMAAEKLVTMREDLVEQMKADVRFRGLLGDVWLASEPTAARMTAIQCRPSVRQQQLGLAVDVADLQQQGRYRLEATASIGGQQAWQGRSPAFAGNVDGSRVVQSMAWPNPQLWDFEQPHLYDLTVSLVDDASGTVIDQRRERFGFRELWLDGRNLMLNGRPVHLRAVNFSGVTRHEGDTTPFNLRATFKRLREMGFNYVICSNYGLDPGETTAFEQLLRTADEEGFALSVSLPHAVRQYDGTRGELGPLWKTAADYMIGVTANHPSALMYAINHNALGYHGDQNPAKIDGLHEQRPEGQQYFYDTRKIAAASEAYARALDPTRELYHHQSGNMGNWHTINIYLCWSPEQERSEWLSHWATEGVKPLFFVEWGPPHQASWGGHRQGPFIWRNNVNSEPLGIEYGAMLTGDAAYAPNEVMEKYVDNYERVYARREPFHISSVFYGLWNADNEQNNVELKTLYTDICWPRLRTWGLTAILPWDYNMVGYREGNASPIELPTDWAKLQQPGVTPDFVTNGGYWQSAHDGWKTNSWGDSLKRWNQDVVAYLAGEPKNFCERGHNVTAGETITKQAVLINDSAATVKLNFNWRLTAGRAPVDEGSGTIEAKAGERAFAPFRVRIPDAAKGNLTLSIRFGTGEAQQVDSLSLNTVEAVTPRTGNLTVFDPKGLTAAVLKRGKVAFTPLQADGDASGYAGLIVGREAITETDPLPDIAPLLAKGRRVLVMEQSAAGLSKRLGFRINDPSLRTVFTRVADHAVLAGLDNDRLRDWRGSGTLLPEQYDLPEAELTDPTFDWLGFANTRVWKWGNTGTVASVVIEKPQVGDFTALVDGGFDLQYSPLLLQRVRGGEVLYCQMDISGRNGQDPAADRLMANLLAWVSQPATPARAKTLRYYGDPEYDLQIGRFGLDLETGGTASAQDVILIGPGGGKQAMGVAEAVKAGATCLVVKQSADDLKGWLPFEVTTAQEARTVSPVPADPIFTGLGPSDLHWRGRREVTLVAGPGQTPNVVNAVPYGQGKFVFCQVLREEWDYDDPYRIYLKRTANRTASMLARLLANCGAPGDAPTVELWNDTSPTRVELTGEWQAAKDDLPSRDIGDLGKLTEWLPIQVPGTFEAQVPAWAKHDGVVWYRRTFDWGRPTNRAVILRVGKVDDEDWTYVNGTLIDHIGKDNFPDDHWQHPREYTVPAGVLQPGENTIVVKVLDTFQSGGIVSGPVDIGVLDRWERSYYFDSPAKLDDPYRYNRW